MSVALGKAYTRIRETTAQLSDTESELARVRRELGAALNTITGLKDELAGALAKNRETENRLRVHSAEGERWVAELQAVIAAAPHGTPDGYDCFCWKSKAPSAVLDAALADAKAEAFKEAVTALHWALEHMPSGADYADALQYVAENNPYRKGQ
jgi:hypothetical protein